MIATADPNSDALEELRLRLDDPAWRLSNLYYIVTKGGDGDGDDLVVKFTPNAAQRKLMRRLHGRDLILKARQMGFTTLVAILWLDTALFSKDPIQLGIIAHEREAAESIFRDKILFAYERLPEDLRQAMPMRSQTKTEIVFAHNGAKIKVATSLRSGTIHRLHVSEFGKIAAKYPAKAREVVAGSIPAVPANGMVIIESTAEGQDGQFYNYVKTAKERQEKGTPAGRKDYRLHFFAWWEAPEYRLDDVEAAAVVYSEADLEYFAKVEAIIGRPLDDGQRAWYVTTLRVDFAGEAPLMWQEYPSYPDEAFAVSTEGCYYATQLAAARKQGRIRPMLPVEKAPVWTFWDLGRGDMTAVWLMQRIGPEYRFIGYHEASGEELDYFVRWLLERKLTYGGHWLPHDANTKRLGQSVDTNKSQREMLEGLLPGHYIDVVPRITNIQSGIQQVRDVLWACWFDEAACPVGLKRLGAYRKEWDPQRGCWKIQPLHDDNSHGADAFRQFAQLVAAGQTFQGGVYRNPDAPASALAAGRGLWKSRRGSPLTS